MSTQNSADGIPTGASTPLTLGMSAPSKPRMYEGDGAADADALETQYDRTRLSASEDVPRWLRPAGRVAVIVQLGVLIAYSSFLYSRFDLSEDFAIEAQAWHQISLNNFNPTSTIYGFPFVRNNMELYMWPLSFLGRVVDNAFILLVVQDVCLGVAAWVAWSWWCDIAERQPMPQSGVLVASALVLTILVASPITYIAAAFDFHSEPIAAPLVVLVGYDLWRGRSRSALLWGVVLLTVHSLGSSYLASIALAAVIVGKGPTRRMGMLLLGLATAWFVLMTSIGSVQSGLWAGYSYLTGSDVPAVSGGAVLAGSLTHLNAAFDMARSHVDSVTRIVTSTGTIGVFCLWGLLPSLVVLCPPALNSSPIFLSTTISFQVVAMVAPMAVGAGWVALQLWRYLSPAGKRRKNGPLRLLGPCVALTVITAAMLGVLWNSQRQFSVWRSWSAVDSGAAEALHRVQAQIPAAAEVIVSSGVSGRFYAARSLYILSIGSTRFPVCSKSVVLVLTSEGMEGGFTPPSLVATAERVARSGLHARPLLHTNGVNAYLYHPQRQTHQINLDPQLSTAPLHCGS